MVEAQKEIISQEQSAIENSMGAVNILLTAFSILIALGGITLGWFINRKEKNVQSLLEQVEKKKKEVERLEEKTANTKKEIVELNDSINNDIEGLYAKLRREETTTLLKRLVYEPKDVVNLGALLVSRDLDTSDFKYLLAAYRKLEKDGDNGFKVEGGVQRLSSKGQYLLLFFQHFCGQALCHELVSSDLSDFFPSAIACAFKNDVINSTTSLANCFNNNEVSINKVEITCKYLKALCESEHSNLQEAYSILVSKYHNDELKKIWEHLNDYNVYIKQFNELICEKCQDDEGFVVRVKAQKETKNR